MFRCRNLSKRKRKLVTACVGTITGQQVINISFTCLLFPADRSAYAGSGQTEAKLGNEGGGGGNGK